MERFKLLFEPSLSLPVGGKLTLAFPVKHQLPGDLGYAITSSSFRLLSSSGVETIALTAGLSLQPTVAGFTLNLTAVAAGQYTLVVNVILSTQDVLVAEQSLFLGGN